MLDDIRTYLSQAVRTDQPGFMNPLWGGLTPEGLAGELVTAATNTSMYTYEIAPLASLIETAVLDRMRQHLRMPTGAGTLTTGGSNGNLMGVLCARQAALPASGHDGFDGRSWCMFVSKEAHYSVAMAANVLGLGRANLIKVDTDGHGRMDPRRSTTPSAARRTWAVVRCAWWPRAARRFAEPSTRSTASPTSAKRMVCGSR